MKRLNASNCFPSAWVVCTDLPIVGLSRSQHLCRQKGTSLYAILLKNQLVEGSIRGYPQRIHGSARLFMPTKNW